MTKSEVEIMLTKLDTTLEFLKIQITKTVVLLEEAVSKSDFAVFANKVDRLHERVDGIQKQMDINKVRYSPLVWIGTLILQAIIVGIISFFFGKIV